MKTITFIILTAFLAAPLVAEVVRPAPQFTWVSATGAVKNSKDFLSRSVVLLIADSPRQWAFRSQVGQLQKMYERLAADKIVCVAAFSQQPGVIRSNIPFVTAADGPRAAFDFQVPKSGFGIAIIGRDGNLDYTGDKVIPVQRIYDILNNSFVPQRTMRK